MASKLSIHPGLRALTGDLVEAAILSICIDSFLKGDTAAIMVGDLADETCATIEEVGDALTALQEQNLIDNPGKPWNEVSSFHVTGITFVAACEQARLNFAEGEETPRGDREQGYDYAAAGGDVYYAEIAPKGKKTSLFVYRIEVDGAFVLNTKDGQTLNSTVLVEETLLDPAAAWDYFDQWTQAKEPDPGAAEA